MSERHFYVVRDHISHCSSKNCKDTEVDNIGSRSMIEEVPMLDITREYL